ncbi:RAP domain/IstB-like ATP binding protein [Nostoc sp. PCC 7524]|uniref:AAA domain-containing protein n=1 Tax=Nostoc sp. (strain ATCC 29411 / PCC 7524) TaxID=28072 RepID=UPI00029EF682|nr:AAA domain-containing protein [Nostoc sp. PCC 7524]AFY49719.1 RAP domain/IstB-like ATP binding protein [Nostoc sp. PCC 7524]
MPFQNIVLEKLFQGVLRNQSVEFANSLTDREKIDAALCYLPLSLSQNQKTALYHAWQHEISYIQGPPGTGKSHTIIAIMITAILLNKKVLFVSQKKAAIDVVKKKIDKILCENSSIYVGPENEDKKHLKAYIEEIVREVSTYNFQSELEIKQKHLHNCQQEINSLKAEIDADYKTLKISLESEVTFWKINSNYVKARDNFSKIYGEEYTKKIKFSEKLISENSKEIYRRNIAKIRTKLEQGTTFQRREILYLRRFYKCFINKINADRDQFTDLANLPLYMEQFFKLTCLYTDSLLTQHQLKPNLNQLRQLINQKQQILLEKQEEYIKNLYEFKLLSSFVKNKKQAELFSKMLYWTNQRKILESMQGIDYHSLTNIFSLWMGEIKDLGQFIPFQNEIFDLVIVDEASQVNIAEIIPAFYRGKSFCIVGDERQLGLSAAGLFALNRTFEKLIWNQCFATVNGAISYEKANEKDLIVSKSSILDFITNKDNQFYIPKVILDEHFRSMPQLAAFTSKEFYDNSLRLMTEVGKNIHKECFLAIEVGGQRDANAKIILAEVEELIKKLKGLIRNQDYLKEPLSNHGFNLQVKPMIGVVSFLTEQKKYIKEQIENEFSDEEREIHDLFVGTPEEFQGNERNIIFITLGLDGISQRWAKGHFENKNRFNVATSRAINFTYLIYGGIPKNAVLLKKYLRHFGFQAQNFIDDSIIEENSLTNRHTWKFDESKIESEFEFRVLDYLREFINQFGSSYLYLYNQVVSCGHKRLDFVIYNSKNEETCAIEVDGVYHFAEDGRNYSDAHLERVEILKRAGWKIVHVPYHKWYKKGWLSERNDTEFQKTINDLYAQLKEALIINL